MPIVTRRPRLSLPPSTVDFVQGHCIRALEMSQGVGLQRLLTLLSCMSKSAAQQEVESLNNVIKL